MVAKAHSDAVITSMHELPVGWVVYFNSARYVDTGDLRDSLLGPRSFVVTRKDGAVIRTKTLPSAGEYDDLIERRQIWLQSASPAQIVTSDAVWTLGGLTQFGPDRDVVRERHPEADDDLVDEAIACATRVLEMVVAILPTPWRGTEESISAVLGQLRASFPMVDAAALEGLVRFKWPRTP